MYLLYSFLYGCALVLLVPYFLFRSLREPSFFESLRERLRGAEVNPGGERSFWIHAVSVGEVIAAGVLAPQVRAAFPGTRIALSVTTPTGRKVAGKIRSVDDVFYCPFDLSFILRRMMARVRPLALVVIETEIWPNLLREARRAGARTLLANGRISDRSFPRYLRFRRALKTCLREIDRFLMQDETYARRVEAMGAIPERVRVSGSLKFDAVPEGAAPPSPRITPPGRRILVAGSTLDPEEAIVLSIFERLRREAPELMLVIAPRHAPRFDSVFALASSRGFRVARRSHGDDASDKDVLLLDTLGELASLYAESDAAFVGGSLVRSGGHNIIEPASWGKPVLFGPHMENFADIASAFLLAGAAVQVKDEGELEGALRGILSSPARREELSRRAREVVAANRGAAERTVQALKELLS
jgi:3-deoxy-D-manno-octulosonic-acid transferase